MPESDFWKLLDTYMTSDDGLKEGHLANLYPSEASAIGTNSYGERIVHGACLRKSWLRVNVARVKSDLPINVRINLGLKDLSSTELAPTNEEDDPLTVQEEAIEARTQWIFDAGNIFERLVIEKAKEAGIFYQGHKKILIGLMDYKYFISGEVDCFFKDPLTHEVIGIEIKSVHGYNAEKAIFGSPRWRAQGGKGKPTIYHMFQAALYAWYHRQTIPYFKVMYIMRDKLLRCEFKIHVELDDVTNKYNIYCDDTFTKLTIEDILDRYNELCVHLENGTLPPRDYDLIYTDSKMQLLSERDELGKVAKEAWDKYWDRLQNGGRQVKRPDAGDFNCGWCSYKSFCYDGNGRPIGHGRDIDDSAEEQLLQVNMEQEAGDSEGTRPRDD